MVYIEGIETKLFGVFLTRKGLGDGAGGRYSYNEETVSDNKHSQ